MEGLIFDLPYTETVNLTVYSDLHLDAESCSVRLLREHMQARAALPNARFCLIGDAGNWVIPRDEKRYRADVPDRRFAAEAAYVNAVVDYHAKILAGFPWLFYGIGNHELTMLNHHSTDVGSLVADRLGVPMGWYSGFARLRFEKQSQFNLLYHHGFSCGVASKGIPPAVVRWASQHQGWDVCAYGHNHQEPVSPEATVYMSERGQIKHRNRYYVNTGTFQRAERHSGPPDYSEVRGHPPVFIGAPLIKIRPQKKGGQCKISIEVGDC